MSSVMRPRSLSDAAGTFSSPQRHDVDWHRPPILSLPSELLAALLRATLDAYSNVYARRSGRKTLTLVSRDFATEARRLDRHALVIASLNEARQWSNIEAYMSSGWMPPEIHEVHLRLCDTTDDERIWAPHYLAWLRHIVGRCRGTIRRAYLYIETEQATLSAHPLLSGVLEELGEAPKLEVLSLRNIGEQLFVDSSVLSSWLTTLPRLRTLSTCSATWNATQPCNTTSHVFSPEFACNDAAPFAQLHSLALCGVSGDISADCLAAAVVQSPSLKDLDIGLSGWTPEDLARFLTSLPETIGVVTLRVWPYETEVIAEGLIMIEGEVRVRKLRVPACVWQWDDEGQWTAMQHMADRGVELELYEVRGDDEDATSGEAIDEEAW